MLWDRYEKGREWCESATGAGCILVAVRFQSVKRCVTVAEVALTIHPFHFITVHIGREGIC